MLVGGCPASSRFWPARASTVSSTSARARSCARGRARDARAIAPGRGNLFRLAGKLIAAGLPARRACVVAIVEPLTDDAEARAALSDLAALVL
jgi:hypothetical protein